MNQNIKYSIILVLSFFLFHVNTMGQVNVDSLLQKSEDTTLPEKIRLNAVFDAVITLEKEDTQRALQLSYNLSQEIWGSEMADYIDSLKMEVLRHLSFRYIYISPDTAIQLSKEMLSLSKKHNHLRHQIRANRRLGMAFEQNGELDSAAIYIRVSMRLRQEAKDKTIIPIGFEDYAGLMITQGEYDSALIYYDRTLQIYEELNFEEEMSNAYNNKGIAYYYLGDVRNAIDNYHLSLAIDEKMGNHEKVAASKANIGMLYQRIGDFEKSAELLTKSYDYYKGQNQSPSMKALRVLEALASLESDKGNYKEAKKIFSQVLEQNRELKNLDRIASTLVNRGLVNAKMEEFDEAILDYKESIQISEETGAIQNLQIALANLGQAYMDIGLVEKAIEASQRVLTLNQQSPSIHEAIIAYNTLYKAYKRKGLNPTALEMYENHILLRDSVASEESRKKVIDQEFAHKYEKKALRDSLLNQVKLTEQEAHFEKKQTRLTFFFVGLMVATLLFFFILQRIRKQKFLAEKRYIAHKAAIEKEDAERARFARDLHDEVGSTLAFSLFTLQRLKKPLKEDEKHLKKLNESIESIQEAMKEVRRVSYDLMPESLESGGLVSAIKELFDQIRSSKGIQIRSEFPSTLDFLTKTEEVQAYRIIKGLVSNTIKHAEASLITLTMEVKDKALHLMYADDGKGLDLAKGMAHSMKKGQGLVGIQERCTLIEADYQMTSSPGNGFAFNLIKNI